MHYGFAIDTKRCIGCHTCAVGCRMENHLPKGIWWNRILTKGGEDMDTPEGIFPDVTMSYVPVACQHCENPACMKACPVGATYKDPETGAVRQDYDKCIGCRMCVAACPYTGVRSFNWAEPEYTIDFECGGTERACPSETYGREMHDVLASPRQRRRAHVHSYVSGTRSILGRSR